jgi:hypothetical protein
VPPFSVMLIANMPFLDAVGRWAGSTVSDCTATRAPVSIEWSVREAHTYAFAVLGRAGAPFRPLTACTLEPRDAVL